MPQLTFQDETENLNVFSSGCRLENIEKNISFVWTKLVMSELYSQPAINVNVKYNGEKTASEIQVSIKHCSAVTLSESYKQNFIFNFSLILGNSCWFSVVTLTLEISSITSNCLSRTRQWFLCGNYLFWIISDQQESNFTFC